MTLSIFNFNTGNDFFDTLLNILSICFLIGAIPAIFKYLVKRIGSALDNRQDWSKTDNPLENYETELSKYYYTKEIRFRVLIRTLPIQLLLFAGLIMMIVGINIGNDNTTAIGLLLFLSFFCVYGFQFYRNGGWKDAGKAFDCYAAKYFPKDYVTEETYEYWDDMPSSSRKLVSSHTYDRNAIPNFWIFFINLPILFTKICMSVTYIALFIIDDLIMTIRYTVFYAFQKKASLKKAQKYYETTIQISAERGFLVPAKIYKDESANKIPNEVNARYLKASYQSVKRGDQSFLLFVNDLPRENEEPQYLTLEVSKKIAKVEMFGNKELHIYETNTSRVYVGTTIGSNDTSVENYFSIYAVPFTPSNEWLQSLATLPADDIRYFTATQSVYLRYMIEHNPPETETQIIHFDLEQGVVIPVTVKLSDVVLGEGDEQFTYEIKNYTPCAISEGDAGYIDRGNAEEPSNSHAADTEESFDDHNANTKKPSKNKKLPPKEAKINKILAIFSFLIFAFAVYNAVGYVSDFFNNPASAGDIPPIIIWLFGACMLLISCQESIRLTAGKCIPVWRKICVFISNAICCAFPLVFLCVLFPVIKLIYVESNEISYVFSNTESQILNAIESFFMYLDKFDSGMLYILAMTSPILVWVLLMIPPRLFAKESKEKSKKQSKAK